MFPGAIVMGKMRKMGVLTHCRFAEAVSRRAVLIFMALLAGTLAVRAATPRLIGVHPNAPDLPSDVPRLLMGSGLTEALEVRVWTAPPLPDDPTLLAQTAGAGQALSATPPPDSQRVDILKFTEHVLVVEGFEGDALWVRNRDGWSTPLPLGCPDPYWIGNTQVSPGAVVTIGGRNLRREQQDAWVAFRGGGVTMVEVPIADYRSGGLVKDPYLLHVRVPAALPEGATEVWLHNRTGGAGGWVSAGTIAVARAEREGTVLNVTDFGANGLDLTIDTEALLKALQAAAPMRAILFLPPGTYRVDAPLKVPPGVTLRGASRRNTVIEAVGGSDASAPPLLTLSEGTRIERLTLRGCLGDGGEALAVLAQSNDSTPVRDVAIVECAFESLGMEGGNPDAGFYRRAFVAVASEGLTVTGSTFRGSVSITQARRADIVRNRFFRAFTDGTALAFSGWESLLDGNVVLEKSGRFLLAPWRRNIVRFNELLEFNDSSSMEPCEGGFELCRDQLDGTRGGLLTVQRVAPIEVTVDRDADVRPGDVLLVVTGRGMGTVRTVQAVDGNTLTVDAPWGVVPDEAGEVWVGPAYLQNVFYGNLNASFGPAIGWHGAVDCVVARHHAPDVNSGPDRPLYGEKTEGIAPVWYGFWRDNRIAGGFVNPTPSGARVPHFANVLAGNWIQRIQSLPEREMPAGRSMIAAGLPIGTGPAHFTVLARNRILLCPVGVWIGSNAVATILRGNQFGKVDHILLDLGRQTVLKDSHDGEEMQ